MQASQVSSEAFDRVVAEAIASLRRSDAWLVSFTPELSFSDIERAAHWVGQRIAAQLSADALADVACEQAEFAACPACGHSTRVTRKKRVLHALDGPVEYLEPTTHCVACRRDFFPSASAIASR